MASPLKTNGELYIPCLRRGGGSSIEMNNLTNDLFQEFLLEAFEPTASNSSSFVSSLKGAA
jgi:hypothetical protein